MALKIRIPRPTGQHPWASLLLRGALLAFAAAALLFFVVFAFYYIKYQHIVDERLKSAALCQHRQDLCRAARGASRTEVFRSV